MVDKCKNRPYTTVVLAMSADGKIADAGRSPARFSSPTDKTHLEQQIAAADAVLFGAGTLRAYGSTIKVSDPELLQQRKQFSLASQPVQILVSLEANIDRQLRFFSQPVPRWLLTTSVGAKRWQGRSEFERIIVCEQKLEEDEVTRGVTLIQNPKSKIQNQIAPSIDWTDALQQLASLGVKRLAVLGGGQLVASMVAADLIDEFWLTVCPLILGGASSPTPVEGMGFDWALAPRLELISVEAKNGEVFLHYRLQRVKN